MGSRLPAAPLEHSRLLSRLLPRQQRQYHGLMSGVSRRHITFPKQMSSTRHGSMLLFSIACCRILNNMPSSGVSLRPPVLLLHSGVLIASVMTTSSGLFCDISILLKTCFMLFTRRKRGEAEHMLSSFYLLPEGYISEGLLPPSFVSSSRFTDNALGVFNLEPIHDRCRGDLPLKDHRFCADNGANTRIVGSYLCARERQEV